MGPRVYNNKAALEELYRYIERAEMSTSNDTENPTKPGKSCSYVPAVGVKLALETMSCQATNTTAVRLGFIIIQKASDSPEGQLALSALDAIPRAMDVLAHHATKSDLLTFGYGILCSVASTNADRLLWTRCDLKPLVAVLREHRERPELQAAVLDLCNGLCHSCECREHLAKLGVTESTIHAMLLHPHDAEVHRWGSAVLHNLACTPALRPKLCALGALEVLIETLKRFQASTQVMERVVGALWELCKDKPNRTVLGRLGGIELLVAVLAQHKTHRMLPFGGSLLLWKLSLAEHNSARLQATPAKPLMRELLLLHGTNPAMKVYGRAVLWRASGRGLPNFGAINQPKLAMQALGCELRRLVSTSPQRRKCGMGCPETSAARTDSATKLLKKDSVVKSLVRRLSGQPLSCPAANRASMEK